MKRIITQIYEIQTPEEAGQVAACGVDHIGSVVLSKARWKQPELLETRRAVKEAGAVSSLILLFTDKDVIAAALDYYQPDIVHFCEDLRLSERLPESSAAIKDALAPLVAMQAEIRERFPDIRIMRSIPIQQSRANSSLPVLEAARAFEPVSDYFLTDTLMSETDPQSGNSQPVGGFVGITGEICSWQSAADLVDWSPIPVILAGGLSPENVFDAVRCVRPAGVDSCTRTNALDAEGRPVRFKKDMDRVRRFVSETCRAAETLAQAPESEKTKT
mgnify:FL=1